MEEKSVIQIAANETDLNTIFGLYLLEKNDDNITQDDFLEFLQSPSIERDIFLNNHTIFDFIEREDGCILKIKLKND